MLMNGTNGNEPGYPEKALVPYPVIVAATKGKLWLSEQDRSKTNVTVTAF